MKKLIVIIICLLAAVSPARTQQANSSSPTTTRVPVAKESTPEIRLKTFQKVWEIVRDKFFDPNFGGINWNDIHTRYAPLVDAVKSDAELYATLTRMLDELNTSHMEIIPPSVIERTSASPVTTGLSLRTMEGQVVVLRLLPGSSAERAGFRPGYVVRQVDGVEVKDLHDAQVRLRGAQDTKVRVTFLDEHDQPRELALDRLLLGSDQIDRQKFGEISLYSLLEVKRLAGGIGYIRFTSFIEPLNKKLGAAIDSMHDAPGLIIDLRGNGGGEDTVAIKMANHLLDKPTQLMITRTRKGDSNYYRARPVGHPYAGPIVVLVDEGSASASEQFTAGMQEIGRVYVIGKKTEGADMDADGAKLPTGAFLLYAAGQPRTPKGVVIDGRGVIPDLEVNLTRAELLKGNDAQLTAAIDYIKQKAAQGSRRAAPAERTGASALPARQ